MEDLFGMILPIIAVVAWISGMFKKEDTDKQQPTRKQPAPRPTPTPSGGRPTTPHRSPIEIEVPEDSGTGVQSYYDKKKEQIEALKNEVQTSQHSLGAGIGDSKTTTNSRNETVKVEQKGKKSISVSRNLTKRGLAESIIMAEVLGPPRAHKPYRSITQDKKY